METEQTIHSLLTKDQYLHNKKAWFEYLDKGTPGNPWLHLLRLLMLDRNVHAGFRPLSSEAKIENRRTHQGLVPNWKLRKAYGEVFNALTTIAKIQSDPVKYKGFYRNYQPDRITLGNGFLYLTPELTQELLRRLELLWAEIR